MNNRSVSPAERQAIIRNIVIEHDRFLELVGALGRFHMPVAGGLHSAGWLHAVVGSSRTGKSFGARRYASRFPETTGEAGKVMPVLYVDMPMEGGGGPRAILEKLAEALQQPITQRMNNPTVIAAILKAIGDRGVQHIILDEWDQVFRMNDRNMLGFGRGLLRKILNLGTVSITCIGLPVTLKLLKVDSQLVGRGGLPCCHLLPYNWINSEERDAFRLLCDEFDQQLPFDEPAGLGTTDFAERLYYVSKGNIGLLKVYVEAASALAINDALPKLDLQHFADTYEDRKKAGSAFNPFVHDLSRAPKKSAADEDSEASLHNPDFLKKSRKSRHGDEDGHDSAAA